MDEDLKQFFNHHIQLYHRDKLAADIWIGESKKDFKIKKYNNKYRQQLFFDSEREITFDTFVLISCARICSSRNVRAEEIADQVKTDDYDVYALLRKTHGMIWDDYLWFRFEDDNVEDWKKYRHGKDDDAEELAGWEDWLHSITEDESDSVDFI